MHASLQYVVVQVSDGLYIRYQFCDHIRITFTITYLV